jgi:hypothetical protein
MIAVPDPWLARAIPEAGRSVRPRRAVVRVSHDRDTYGILDAPPLGAPFGHDGGLDRRLGGVRVALIMAGGS